MKFLGSVGGQEPDEPVTPDELRAFRVEQARTRTRWTEVESTRFVPRGRWLIDAESDCMYSVYPGATFGRDGKVEFGDQNSDLVFFVDHESGEPVVLEPAAVARTWSDFVYAAAR
jgi:hypothetical protein